jgi:hypothetical protein
MKSRPNRIGIAWHTLLISAMIHAILALMSALLLQHLLLAILFLLMSAALFFSAAGLVERRPWAWTAGHVLFWLHALSIMMPFGLVGLWAMWTSGGRDAYLRGQAQG